MIIGYMKPSFLVLLVLVAAMHLFYAAYISSSPFVVRLPNTNSPHSNESLALEISNSSQNNLVNSDEIIGSKIINKSTVLTTPSPALAQYLMTNRSLNVADSQSQAVLPQSIYISGHVDANPILCPDLGNSLQLLIIIASAPAHAEARMAIRQTWGHFKVRRDVSIAFMLGTTTNNSLQNKLNSEEYIYGDIIQGKFIDTYDNITLKTISMLEWVDIYCPNVAFVLKSDDDMFINVSKLLSLIGKHNKNDRIIYGRLAKKWKPIRNKMSKYYISRQQYKPAVYPDFTTGPAYLISSCVVHDLYLAALNSNHTYFKLEDVFVTGIVAHDINVKRVHVNVFLNERISFHPCNIQKGISIHMVSFSEQFDLWKKLLDGRSKCT